MSMVADIASISCKENGKEVEAAAAAAVTITMTIAHLDIRSFDLALARLSTFLFSCSTFLSRPRKNAMNNLEQRVTLLDVLI